jgi:hypothetical protein
MLALLGRQGGFLAEMGSNALIDWHSLHQGTAVVFPLRFSAGREH